MNKKSLYYKLIDVFVCMYCMYMYICFWKMLNCSHPQAKLPLVSLSSSLSLPLLLSCLFASFDLKHVYHVFYGTNDAETCHHSVIKGGWELGLAGGRECEDSITTPMHEVFFSFFLPILCVIKLDNCTVLMTSSNMLSIINVTKSNLDIKCVRQWYTAMLFHCLYVWTCFFVCLFVLDGVGACVCLQNIDWWLRLFSDGSEYERDCPQSVDYKLCLITLGFRVSDQNLKYSTQMLAAIKEKTYLYCYIILETL